MFLRNEKARVYTDPVWEKTYPFYFLGIGGPAPTVNIADICLRKEADQIVTEYTFDNVFAGVITLGLYTPRTLKVWCQL